MCHIKKEALKYHLKRAGNGYVYNLGHDKVYFYDDTKDIPEMRNLTWITKVFVCINMFYTTTVEQGVESALTFKPKQVYPYHYKGKKV